MAANPERAPAASGSPETEEKEKKDAPMNTREVGSPESAEGNGNISSGIKRKLDDADISKKSPAVVRRSCEVWISFIVAFTEIMIIIKNIDFVGLTGMSNLKSTVR
jgi:hypothetical protein